MTDKHRFHLALGEYEDQELYCGELLNFAAQLGLEVFAGSLTFSHALLFLSLGRKLNLETVRNAINCLGKKLQKII